MKIIISHKTKGVHELIFDDEDYELVRNYVWVLDFRKNNKVYAVASKKVCVGRFECIKFHRLLFGFPHSSIIIDHKDGNGLNNRRINLRVCSNSQNLMNRGAPKNNTTGFKGVYFSKEKKK